MRKIDVTPSVEMLHACFRTAVPFSVRFKRGVRIGVEYSDDPEGGDYGFVLRRYNREEETSWLSAAFEGYGESTSVRLDASDPLVREMARGIWQYRKRDEDVAPYLAQVMAVYGGRTGDIIGIER